MNEQNAYTRGYRAGIEAAKPELLVRAAHYERLARDIVEHPDDERQRDDLEWYTRMADELRAIAAAIAPEAAA